jgi:hypothetical protein
MATHKISLSSIEVKTNDYANTYGKDPKGFGRWAFQVGENVEFITSNYGEAVKAAKLIARQNNVSRIEVLG